MILLFFGLFKRRIYPLKVDNIRNIDKDFILSKFLKDNLKVHLNYLQGIDLDIESLEAELSISQKESEKMTKRIVYLENQIVKVKLKKEEEEKLKNEQVERETQKDEEYFNKMVNNICYLFEIDLEAAVAIVKELISFPKDERPEYYKYVQSKGIKEKEKLGDK